jgi:hypothetical protein
MLACLKPTKRVSGFGMVEVIIPVQRNSLYFGERA